MTHDYTRKGGVVHTEIILPPHALPSFADRSTLWNSVELYEKAGNAQLAREIDAALPIELSREEQIRLVREYCSSQFVSRGMCVDFVIHDTNSGNPHCHIMLTMRPLDERGAWAAKSKRNMTLMKTVSASACQAADTRRTKLTLQAGTTRTTPSCGARHGLTIPTTFGEERKPGAYRPPQQRRARHRRDTHRPHGRGGLPDGEERYRHRERRTEPQYPKGKPPYPGNPGADWEAQGMDCRPVQSAGNRPGTAAAISQPCKSADEVFERSERKEPEVFAKLAAPTRSRRTENHSGSGQLSFRAWYL